MRWPWVSREHFDAAVRLAARIDDANALLSARFDNLLDKFTSLRLAGASIPEPVTPREAKEIDPLKQAVLNASIGKPPSVRAAMLKQLAEDRSNPLLDDADIQRRIESGFTSDDVGLPE